jgi:hypothetical protein
VQKRLTEQVGYAYPKTVFNFIKDNMDQTFRNLYDTAMLRELFRQMRDEAEEWNIVSSYSVRQFLFDDNP